MVVDNIHLIKIAIGCDHAGFVYKKKIITRLREKKIEINDFGCFSEESVDYPDFAHLVAKAVKKGSFDRGIILCGSGNGVVMSANRHRGIRAALCWTPIITKLARTHNDANICCLPARFISYEEAQRFVDIFIKTEFTAGRHQKRIEKIEIN